MWDLNPWPSQLPIDYSSTVATCFKMYLIMFCLFFSVCQAVVYHLAELKGMAEWYERFGVLGLSGHMVQQALSTAGSLMLKASELQQYVLM